jgi:hypothetical protein
MPKLDLVKESSRAIIKAEVSYPLVRMKQVLEYSTRTWEERKMNKQKHER